MAGERRLIFSRKGFDSGVGGKPSPVLPDGRMVSLPIPELGSPVTYGDCMLDPGVTYADLIARLGVNEIIVERNRKKERCLVGPTLGAHLDPDLRQATRDHRPTEWRPMFGQVGSAERHLEIEQVGTGDIFLFFGWFAHADERFDGSLRYQARRHHFQALWGWMEIADALPAREFAKKYPWAWRQHPHLFPVVPKHYTFNTVYLAAERSALLPGLPGWGLLRYSDSIRLTHPGRSPLCWSLPDCFHPSNTIFPMTWHAKPSRWSDPADGRVILESVRRGQEFVIPISDAIHSWLIDLLAGAETW